jgi:hypothetical protein
MRQYRSRDVSLLARPSALDGSSPAILVRQEDVAGLGVELVSMDAVFQDSDYVAVNTLLSDQTRDLIGRAPFPPDEALPSSSTPRAAQSFSTMRW